jgi:hypothetical protein
VRSVGTPVKVGNEVPEAHRGPLRNEHAEAILRDLLDYDDTKIAKLGGEGAFGQVYAKI